MHLLYSSLCGKQLKCTFPFIPCDSAVRSPFTEEKAEAQRCSVTCPTFHSLRVMDLGFRPGLWLPCQSGSEEHKPFSSQFNGTATGRKLWDQGSPLSDRHDDSYREGLWHPGTGPTGKDLHEEKTGGSRGRGRVHSSPQGEVSQESFVSADRRVSSHLPRCHRDEKARYCGSKCVPQKVMWKS